MRSIAREGTVYNFFSRDARRLHRRLRANLFKPVTYSLSGSIHEDAWNELAGAAILREIGVASVIRAENALISHPLAGSVRPRPALQTEFAWPPVLELLSVHRQSAPELSIRVGAAGYPTPSAGRPFFTHSRVPSYQPPCRPDDSRMSTRNQRIIDTHICGLDRNDRTGLSHCCGLPESRVAFRMFFTANWRTPRPYQFRTLLIICSIIAGFVKKISVCRLSGDEMSSAS